MNAGRTVASGALAVALLVGGCTGGADTPTEQAACRGELVGTFAITRVAQGDTIGNLSLYRDATDACAVAAIESDDVAVESINLRLLRCQQHAEDQKCTMDYGEHPAEISLDYRSPAGPIEVLAPTGSCVYADVEVNAGGETIAETATRRLRNGEPSPMCSHG